MVNNVIPGLKSRFVLIVASDDYTFPKGTGDKRHNMFADSQGLISQLFASPLLIHTFVENLDTNAAHLTPIPLGIGISSTCNSNKIKLDDYLHINLINRHVLCFCTHRIRSGPQYDDRRAISSLCQKEWQKFVKFNAGEISRKIFAQELKRAKFCLCIHGGGYDPCPRFFECILYGTIPIIQHSPLDPVFKRFPVVFLEDLTADALSEEFLLRKLDELKEFYEGPKRASVLNLLSIDYWWDMIKSKFESVSREGCARYGCSFLVHSDRKNNNGLYCCKSCMNNIGHGNLCEHYHI